MDKMTEPVSGLVWFDEGGTKVPAKVPALIFDTWNGWAVAEVADTDVEALFGGMSVTRSGDKIEIHVPEMGEIYTLLVKNGRVALGEGWILDWQGTEAEELERRSP